MKHFISKDGRQKSGVCLLLFHCVFSTDGSITHFMHKHDDQELYRRLPNLYAVCIAETSKGRKRITGGFVIKTSYSHNDPDFAAILADTTAVEPRLANLINERSSYLPTRISIVGEDPITEAEMLKVIVTRAFKHGVAGTA